jgi:catechol 2,3-dioxygenase-like lactoylglutathione lyase family enzyme
MQKVLGIGGLFFRAKDPENLAQLHKTHLGISKVPGDYETPPWQSSEGTTVFEPFSKDSDYFGRQERQHLLNFRASDLDAMIAQLEAAGIEVIRDAESYPNGSFARIHDPKGNPVELWQPA